MNNRIVALVVGLLVVSLPLVGQIDRTRKPEPGPTPKLTLPTIQRSTLPNGLKIMLVEHHELPVVQMLMVIQSGAALDPDGKAGLASLTAQMVDEGTTTRTALQIADDIDFLGANLFINASYDATTAGLLTLKEHLPAATEIYSDVLLNPSFPESEWERVKKIHLTSLLQQKDQPGIVADKVYSLLTFGDQHPYGRPSSGTEATVSGITTADLKKFHETHYRPNNATLIVVGDVTMKEISPVVEKHFGQWKQGTVPQPSYPPPPTVPTTRLFLVDKPQAAQSEIRIGHVGISRTNEDYFPVVVLNTILGGQFSSRVNMNLRETKGYTYGARTGFSMWKQPGAFTAQAAVKTAVTDSSVIEFMKELRRIVEEDVTEKELTFAKNSLIRREPQGFETPQQIANQLATLVLYNLPDNYFNTYVQNFEKITITDVRRVAKKYLNPGAVNIVIVGDVATIRDGLEKLGYGKATILDADGKQVN